MTDAIASILIPGFLMGAAGSLHCVGMCGPLALSLPGTGGGTHQRLAGVLLYNGGRTLTYSAYGALLGAVGGRFAWFGWQQRISVGLGIALLAYLLLSGRRTRSTPWRLMPSTMARWRMLLSRHLFDPRPSARFLAGILNGLLPCGIVYMALAGAALAGSVRDGTAFMAAFGLGTLPAMAVLMLTGGLLRPGLRRELSRAYPAVLAVMACLLIIRGLNLGIPFLSPSLRVSGSTPVECH